MATETRTWWPNWYVTRLHLTECAPDESLMHTGPRAVCGADTRNPHGLRAEWQQRRIAKGAPKCKHCERRMQPTPDPQEDA